MGLSWPFPENIMYLTPCSSSFGGNFWELKRKLLENLSRPTRDRRRMELIADKNGIKVYDDYGTAIAATLQGLRELYPSSRIWLIDEPHGFAENQCPNQFL